MPARGGRLGRLGLLVAVTALALGGLVGLARTAAPGRPAPGLDDASGLFRLLSPQGDPLLVTGIRLSVGDRFLAPDNGLYEVVRVEDDMAITRWVGRHSLEASRPEPLPALAAGEEAGGPVAAAGDGQRRGPLAIYHTHSDESYLPNSGATNVPWNGDIFEVGREMSTTWRSAGLRTLHSYRRHDPHDGEAYLRSRRTAVELLRQRPAALFDVHRDTPPAWVYRRVVRGHRLASVLLVLGRQNPSMAANEAFAFAIKGYADKAFPGLIRGILYVGADYNQDLHPRALLAEVGSTYNRLEEALAGARFFSAVVPAVLFGMRLDPSQPPPPSALERDRSASRAGWRAAAILLALAVGGAALFVIVNEDAYEAASALGARVGQALRGLLRRQPPEQV